MGRSCQSIASISFFAYCFSSTFQNFCPPLLLTAVIHSYTWNVTPCLAFGLCISPSTTPRTFWSPYVGLPPSSCCGYVSHEKFQLSYQHSVYKPTESFDWFLRPYSNFLLFISWTKSSITCKHVHMGICMRIHVNMYTYIYRDTHTWTHILDNQ